MLINIGRWRILKKNSKKQFELWRKMMDYQRSHPEKRAHDKLEQAFLCMRYSWECL